MAKFIATEERAIQARALREGMGMTQLGLFQVSGFPVPTIDAYEREQRKVPQEYLDRLQALYARDKEVTRRVIAGVVADIERKYPHGIPSEVKP